MVFLATARLFRLRRVLDEANQTMADAEAWTSARTTSNQPPATHWTSINAYAAAARANTMPAYGPTEFVEPFKKPCDEAGISVRRHGQMVFLCDVKLASCLDFLKYVMAHFARMRGTQ